MRQLMFDGMREQVVRTPLTANRASLKRYLAATIGQLPHERLVAFFADAKGGLLAEEILAEGPEDHLPISSRRLIARAMNLNARTVVLAHNHPSGCAEPSQQDIQATKSLARLADQLGIRLLDHFIVTASAVTSCADRGVL